MRLVPIHESPGAVDGFAAGQRRIVGKEVRDQAVGIDFDGDGNPQEQDHAVRGQDFGVGRGMEQHPPPQQPQTADNPRQAPEEEEPIAEEHRPDDPFPAAEGIAYGIEIGLSRRVAQEETGAPHGQRIEQQKAQEEHGGNAHRKCRDNHPRNGIHHTLLPSGKASAGFGKQAFFLPSLRDGHVSAGTPGIQGGASSAVGGRRLRIATHGRRGRCPGHLPSIDPEIAVAHAGGSQQSDGDTGPVVGLEGRPGLGFDFGNRPHGESFPFRGVSVRCICFQSTPRHPGGQVFCSTVCSRAAQPGAPLPGILRCGEGRGGVWCGAFCGVPPWWRLSRLKGLP